MKFVKGFSLFFLYPALMFGIGFLGGITFMDYFYPGKAERSMENVGTPLPMDYSLAQEEALPGEQTAGGLDAAGQDITGYGAGDDIPQDQPQEVKAVASSSETLNVDTEYVLEETDMRTHTVVETTWRLPDKYVGMNREQFLEAMEMYEASPPLSEMERGFVSLEVLSFSRKRVVVRMNYQYVQPSESFYLMVEDNFLVVYLDDRQTVYMNTDIQLTDLPDDVQQDIIQTLFMPDEESLYDFLETYSS